MKDINLDNFIRKVKDFPKPGILFYDITSIFTQPEAFSWIIEKAFEMYKDKKIDMLLAVESRGFIFASPLAYKMKIPLVLARKAGKLPGATIKENYALEYGTATLEVHKEDIPSGKNILIIDDLIATGGTLKACANLVKKLGSNVTGFFAVIGLPFLNYEKLLEGYDIKTLINYHSE
ncbi:MAG TPA: adenine phosphoribosyltransferase [Spirochaetota bacterium]|nr:adenine phosphoribosyltransferase [Spirochaetota bacterium]HOL57226.1 adenine phosphoribosyltransferase [Spirochaetota bacterium]HPP04861.1 adenine phosphoribosyltransferase [Spirochaetota bacterium]